MQRLAQLGFHDERLRFGEVDNLWARRGESGPLFCFAGHTDVVPPGPLEHWQSPPFQPEIRDGMLYGRGAADMKGSLAAMLTASERFVAAHPNHKGSIAFLITSDEEGPAVDGTVKVVKTLQARGEMIDWCLVGEPSSTNRVGDVVRNGRRGSLGGVLRVAGIQGHVAYPHLARNPVHEVAPALVELTHTKWDQGNEFFPATTLQISNIHAGTGATNVIPASCEITFNLRYSTETSHDQLRARIEALLDRHGLEYAIDWTPSGLPFLTPRGELIDATQAAITTISSLQTKLSTAGGTSDGRFIAPTGAQVIELGPCNATIHQLDECVAIDDLNTLSAMYEQILQNLLA